VNGAITVDGLVAPVHTKVKVPADGAFAITFTVNTLDANAAVPIGNGETGEVNVQAGVAGQENPVNATTMRPFTGIAEEVLAKIVNVTPVAETAEFDVIMSTDL
jgi:hypothetical protein